MRILFVVCGEGLGHASRCINLGHYLEQRGHSVSFVAYGKSYDFFHDHGCTNVYRGEREVYLEGANGFFSLKKTLWCSKWTTLNLARSGLRVRRLIREHIGRIDFFSFQCDFAAGMFAKTDFHSFPGFNCHLFLQ